MRDMVMALVSAFFLLMFLLMTQGCSDPTPHYAPPLPHTRKAGGWSPCCWSPAQLALLEQMKV